MAGYRRFLPCGTCCTPPACTVCPDVGSIELDISGFADNSCSYCEEIDGTYILTPTGTNCEYRYQSGFLGGCVPPGGDPYNTCFLLIVAQVQVVGSTVRVGVTISLNYSYGFSSEWSYYTYQADFADCDITDGSLSYTGTSGSLHCNGSGATILASVLPP